MLEIKTLESKHPRKLNPKNKDTNNKICFQKTKYKKEDPDQMLDPQTEMDKVTRFELDAQW